MQIVVLDTETTGLEPESDRLVEIGGVTRSADGELRLADGLCCPRMPIPPEAMATHHLTDEMVIEAPDPEVTLRRIMEELQITDPSAMILAAHNAPFDRGFLSVVDPELLDPDRWLCTYRLAMHAYPDAPGFGCQVLRYWLGLAPQLPVGLWPHRALYDAVCAEAILTRIISDRGWTITQMLDLSARPAILKKPRMGKWKGVDFKEIPWSYLRWMANEEGMDDDHAHTALCEMRLR